MRRAAHSLALLCLVWAGSAFAVSDPSEMLGNRPLELRAEAIGRQLRCLVCQNESIEASDADLARDLRRAIRQQVAAGASDRQVMDWMVARYGDFVRLRPPFDGETILLWSTPVLALAIGFGVVLAARRRAASPARPLTDEELPLTDEELERVRTLLRPAARHDNVVSGH
ncbi:MAG: cytochrome c-type biogenesis protein CcmH [Rhodopila sp.]